VIFNLVWENVRFRPVRTLLSMLLIAVPVTLILTLVGMSRGFLEDSARRSEGVGADILFRPPGSSIMTFSGAPLSDKFVDQLAKEPHVAAATGVIMQLIGGAFDSVTGIDPWVSPGSAARSLFWRGTAWKSRMTCWSTSIMRTSATSMRDKSLRVLNRDWNVVGVVEPGKLAHLYVRIDVLQSLTGNTGKVSQIYLKLDDPRNTQMVMDQLKARYEGYPTYSMKDLASYYSVSNIPLLQGSSTQ